MPRGHDRDPGRARHPRLRRILVVVLVLLVVSAGSSLVFNAVTDGRRSSPAGLRFVQAGDVRTRYLEWGSAGSPVVLVHGFVESADTWRAVGERLAATGHRVFALDLDGWGYSQRVAPYDAAHQAAQLLAFVDALHLRRPVLVGHSSGAAIVALAALRRPSVVGGVMFLDGDALATGAGGRSPLRHLVVEPFRTTLLRLALGSDSLVRSIYGSACGPPCPRLDARGVDQWRRPLQVAGAEQGLWAMLGEGVPGVPVSRLERLRDLPFPKAVVFGGADDTFSKDAPFTTARRIGAPRPTVIPGAAHLTPVNSPGQVATAVGRLARH
ncbi:MAG: alpha/beta hydrolase fold protein [Marmoricola sp.]|nr:alpha/beta hydrolase fold protein [Marmoricola sp.]